MELLSEYDPWPENYHQHGEHKFVAISDADDSKVVSVFGLLKQHADVAEELLTQRSLTDDYFLAAGTVNREEGILYGSTTCRRRFGHQAPLDAQVSENLRAEIREKLEFVGFIFNKKN